MAVYRFLRDVVAICRAVKRKVQRPVSEEELDCLEEGIGNALARLRIEKLVEEVGFLDQAEELFEVI